MRKTADTQMGYKIHVCYKMIQILSVTVALGEVLLHHHDAAPSVFNISDIRNQFFPPVFSHHECISVAKYEGHYPGKTLCQMCCGALLQIASHIYKRSNGGVVNALCLATRIRVLCAGWGDATGSSRDWTCLPMRRWHPPPSCLNVVGWI